MTPEHARAVLSYFARLEPIERRIRRRESVAIPLTTALVVLYATVIPALFSGAVWDCLSVAAACVYALALRWWIVGAIERRRQWRFLCGVAAEARRTLGA